MQTSGDTQSVIGRIGTILDAFTMTDTALGVSELSRRTGLPKSTVFRLVRELVAQGLLERHGHAVRLGLRLFEIGQQVPRQRVLRDAAARVLADLRSTTGHTVHLACLQDKEVLYVDILRGNECPPMPSRVGGRFPAHATGVGKVILAYSPESVVRGVLASGLTRVSIYTIINERVLVQQFAKIRSAGVGFDFEESAPGVVCVASPVLDPSGTAVAALSLAGASTRLHPPKLVPLVRSAASALTRQMYGSVATPG